MDLIEQLQSAPPKFHFWGGEHRIGGFGPSQLALLKACIADVASDQPVRCLETGAGLSTVWWLAHGVKLKSFFIDPALGERITAYLQENSADEHLDRWSFAVGRSELTLPRFINKRPKARFDVCLIDGGHGIHSVFTDFTYQNYLLRKGGLLLVDDIQLGSCGLLHEILKRDDNFEYFADAQKLVAFRKLTDKRFLPDFGGQTFLDPLLSALQAVGGP